MNVGLSWWLRQVLYGAKQARHTVVPGSDAVVLSKRFIVFRNGFGPIAVVHCLPGGHGTVMRVTLRSRIFTAAHLSLWLGGVLIVNLLVIFQSATGHASIAALPFTLIPLALLMGGIAFGRHLSRGEGPELLNFIRQTTGAQDLAPELRSIC